MRQSGYYEATQWLARFHLEWRLTEARTTLVAGATLGAPTEQRVEVYLTNAGRDVTLTGEAPTMLEAVQRAVGAWEAK